MRTTRAIAVVLIAAAAAAAGCKKAPGTCAQLGPVIVAWGRTQLAADHLTGDAAAERTQLFALTAELYPRVCETSRWSGDAIDCMIAAATEADAQRCGLTKDQGDALQKALAAALLGDAKGGK
jgi:hypothetical protein